MLTCERVPLAEGDAVLLPWSFREALEGWSLAEADFRSSGKLRKSALGHGGRRPLGPVCLAGAAWQVAPPGCVQKAPGTGTLGPFS